MILRALLVLPTPTANFVRSVLTTASPHRIDVVGSTSRIADLNGLLENVESDVVFVDPTMDAGDTIRSWRGRVGAFPVLVCMTETAQHAVEAFEAGAAHFIVAPYTEESLHIALSRAAMRVVRYDRGTGNGSELRESSVPFRARILALPSHSGIDIRSVDDVIRVNGEGSYTRVTLQSQPAVILSKCLGDLEQGFSRVGLVRVHRSHMINLTHVRQVRRGKTPILKLSNGDEVDVSLTYRDILFDMLQLRIGRRQDRA